jgi:uncharacterized membrane protein YfcA
MFKNWLRAQRASIAAIPHTGWRRTAWVVYPLLHVGAAFLDGTLGAIGWLLKEMGGQALGAGKSLLAPLLWPTAIVLIIGSLATVMTPDQLAPPLAVAAVLYFGIKLLKPKKKKKKKGHG